MTSNDPSSKLHVLIAGGGVAALEAALALADLAPDLTTRTILSPAADFVMRPMTVREPFSMPAAQRWPVASVAAQSGATLVADGLERVDADARVVHTTGGDQLRYDVLLIATGARAVPRFKHAITVDDRSMDESLHGLIQDVEEGYVKHIAFLSPGRMGWPLPLYELAMLTATRAHDMDVELRVTIATPEDAPLGIFGTEVSSAVADVLHREGIEMITGSYPEVPHTGEVVLNPGDRRLEVDRVVALPELFGPSVRGLPLHEHGFIRVNSHGRVSDAENVYAAGDVTDFALKHGGASSQQADCAAEAIAALAGADITPQPFHPVIHGMLLTGGEPLYMTARITGGHGFASEVEETPGWAPATKIASRYLAPCLERISHPADASGS